MYNHVSDNIYEQTPVEIFAGFFDFLTDNEIAGFGVNVNQVAFEFLYIYLL